MLFWVIVFAFALFMRSSATTFTDEALCYRDFSLLCEYETTFSQAVEENGVKHCFLNDIHGSTVLSPVRPICSKFINCDGVMVERSCWFTNSRLMNKICEANVWFNNQHKILVPASSEYETCGSHYATTIGLSMFCSVDCNIFVPNLRSSE